jgi:hypothetical protein
MIVIAAFRKGRVAVDACTPVRRDEWRITEMRSLQIGLFFCFLISLSVVSTTHSQAQYAINMSLVTCTQYLALPPERSRIFSAWMSGWFNQKTGYTYVNLEAYARNIENVKAWCAANPGELVMTGLQRATAQ